MQMTKSFMCGGSESATGDFRSESASVPSGPAVSPSESVQVVATSSRSFSQGTASSYPSVQTSNLAPSWSSYQYGGPNLPQQRPLPQQQLLKPVDPVHHTAPEMGAKKNETEGNVVLNCGSSDSDTASTADAAQEPGATGKKKTPMCLVNELARHHKLQPQYKLTGETGPAHQKFFTVNLILGDEEYEATGPSIKKTQHAAAQQALENSKYPLPQPKPKVKNTSAGTGESKPIMPTVQLNALAMKLNLPPVYTSLSPVPTMPAGAPSFAAIQPPNSGSRVNGVGPTLTNAATCVRPMPGRFPNSANQRYFVNRFPPMPMTHRVSLTVGEVKTMGEGPTPQAARHDAARQALEELREKQRQAEEAQQCEVVALDGADADTDLKSPVSVVHELALKLNRNVEFAVVTESGPPHMKNFVIQCKLAEWFTQSDGNCKKLAKKKAAELMLAELKKAYPNGITTSTSENGSGDGHRLRPKTKSTTVRKKPRNLVKDSSESNGGVGGRPQDPISHLVQLQQARKEKEPVFTVVSERGIPRQPEFVVQVAVGTIVTTGTGAKKKEAKRAAALAALEALGVGVASAAAAADAGVESGPSEAADVLDAKAADAPAPAARSSQIAGVLILPRPLSDAVKPTPKASTVSQPAPFAGALASKATKTSTGCVRPENRLVYLAQVLGHEVDFSDFSKGSSFISLVTMNTSPPKVSHGTGPTLEEAHDNAAENMLKLLAGADLDQLSSGKDETSNKHCSNA